MLCIAYYDFLIFLRCLTIIMYHKMRKLASFIFCTCLLGAASSCSAELGSGGRPSTLGGSCSSQEVPLRALSVERRPRVHIRAAPTIPRDPPQAHRAASAGAMGERGEWPLRSEKPCKVGSGEGFLVSRLAVSPSGEWSRSSLLPQWASASPSMK